MVIIQMVIRMSDLRNLIRLQAWMSPAFPTGAFSYSSGLEAASANGLVTDKVTLNEWLKGMMRSGPGWNDCVVMAECWRRAQSGEPLGEISDLARSMNLSATRQLETTAQGDAFLKAAQAWCEVDLSTDCPLPVAVGAVSGKLEIDLEQTLAAYLHAYVSNQIQAALRLVKLGQQAGVEVLSELEEIILQTAQRATTSTFDDLGSNAFMADVVAMQHETLESRIFRS